MFDRVLKQTAGDYEAAPAFIDAENSASFGAHTKNGWDVLTQFTMDERPTYAMIYLL